MVILPDLLLFSFNLEDLKLWRSPNYDWDSNVMDSKNLDLGGGDQGKMRSDNKDVIKSEGLHFYTVGIDSNYFNLFVTILNYFSNSTHSL